MKIHWEYYFARKFSLQRYQIVAQVFISSFFWEHFKVKIKNILIKPEGDGNYAICMDKSELVEMQEKVFKVVCKNLKNFYYYKRIIKQVQKNWVVAARQVAQTVSRRNSRVQLLALYNTFIYHHQEHFNKPIWLIFPVEPLLAEAAEKSLRAVLNRANMPQEYNRWLQVIFSAEEQNAITKAQKETMALALKIKEQKIVFSKVNRELKQLVEDFGFIPCYDVIDAPWDAAHFQDELKNYLCKATGTLREDLAEIESRSRRSRAGFRLFLEFFPMRTRERELFIMAHELVFIKDERDDYRRRGSYFGRALFEEIGQRLGLSLREVAYLTIEETREAIKNGLDARFTSIVRERTKGYALIKEPDQPFVVASGIEMTKLLQLECGEKLVASSDAQIKGRVGSVGRAEGQAVIVHTKHDLRRVFDGAIMVAVTTNPDYVPAMMKCRAIITDEGGLTCHAAIVARELKKPCIVGTKIATKVLKDGDLVEVDAEKGIVRKV